MAWHGIHAQQQGRQVLTHVVAPLQDVIASSPPSVILMELNPSQMEAVGLADAATLLQQLYDMGYTDISHSGWELYVALKCAFHLCLVIPACTWHAHDKSPHVLTCCICMLQGC